MRNYLLVVSLFCEGD
uniref:Uncharacterized protein n=1 Tax=Arundo donax TaxID=35708 RepID=A0A0A9A4J9_ARUDO